MADTVAEMHKPQDRKHAHCVQSIHTHGLPDIDSAKEFKQQTQTILNQSDDAESDCQPEAIKTPLSAQALQHKFTTQPKWSTQLPKCKKC